MSYEHVNAFLERFRSLEPPERSVKQALIAAIAEEVGEALAAEDVTLQSGVVFISAHPAVKSDIALKKSAILGALERHLPNARTRIRDIR